jgi:hypothetical protein
VSVVRIEALRALARLIELAIPELEGHVCVGVAPSGEKEEIPNVSINPSRWAFEPYQEAIYEPAATLPGHRVVFEIGNHECAVAISVVAATPAQRWELEDQILGLFLQQKHPLSGFRMPGTIMIPVTAIPELASWTATYDLDTDEWIDALAIDRRYESKIMATCLIPALTVDEPVYTIEQLLLGVRPLPPPGAAAPAVSLVTINVDGSIAPFVP